MKYIDLHCDALLSPKPCVKRENLEEGDCLMQVFAAFVSGERLFDKANALFEKFDELSKGGISPVRKFSDIQSEKINALLSVEEGGALEGSLEKLAYFHARGVRLITLTWNFDNEIGSPNFRGDPKFREKERGLTAFGREVVAKMCDLSMAVDVSHGSDKLVEDVASVCKERGKPFLASHSGAEAVLSHARNLEDRQIRLIADSGGVIGLPFCMDFISSDRTPEEQREGLLRHARHLLNVGGEDILCLGSDFDGTEENAFIKGPKDVPRLLSRFEKEFSPRVAEKIAKGNALRFFKDVLE